MGGGGGGGGHGMTICVGYAVEQITQQSTTYDNMFYCLADLFNMIAPLLQLST